MNGRLTVACTHEEIKTSLDPMKHALVAKFSGPRPSVDVVRALIRSSWGLTSDAFAGVINANHLLLCFASEDDCVKAWSREFHVINGIHLRIFPWSPSFRPGIESSRAPVWINLPLLPCNFFEDYLASIVSGVGLYLTMDGPTRWKTRPGVAHVCVQMGLLNLCS